MKWKFASYALVLSFLVLLTASTTTDSNKKDEILIQVLLKGLSQYHYQPHEINDEFSKKVFELYVKSLDYNKRFFLAEDIALLKKYELELDNQAKHASYSFFEQATKIFDERIVEVKGYFEEVLAKPFDFSTDETVEADADKLVYATDKSALKERWRKSLKHQTLSRLFTAMKSQEKKKEAGDLKEEKSFEALEVEAREKVLKSYQGWFKRLSKNDRTDQMATYINSITRAYDPHTGYFPPKQKENFDIQMSGRLEGIGAKLQQKDGYIEVTEIIPGSASWKQGDLKANDVILKVAQGEDEPVDVVDMRLDDAVQLIRGKKDTEVRLTVKKVDGTIAIVPIIRDVVLIEEGYAKSAIIQDEAKKEKIGYIKLPKFYADFNRADGRSCFKDVKAEISKLKDENIDGLVLDLRNNTGGSLQDVVDMAGLFIEEGPIVQVKSKDSKPYIFNDRDNTIQYDGDLVILVNSFSASASEILAAAMQDYGRAIIMGSNTTFGKGTVQRFINLDRTLSSKFDAIKPLGSVKMTIQKFYRIDGTTNQLKGVIPDIVLPDTYSYIEIGEKEQEYAMSWDEIEPADYKKWTKLNSRLKKVQKNSKDRVSKNTTFQLIEENAKRLKQQRDETVHTLCFDKYKDEQGDLEEESKKYENVEKETGLTISSLAVDEKAIQEDETKKARTETWHKNLKKDAYLEEAIQVIQDI